MEHTDTLLRTLLSEPVFTPETTRARLGAARQVRDATAHAVHWALRATGLDVVRQSKKLRQGLPFTAPADVLLIVPPFASLWYPSLGVHVLQACARAAGFRVDVLYANILLAASIGERSYEQIGAESVALAAERFFARCAFGLPPLGHGASEMFEPARIYGQERGELYRGLYPDGRAASLGTVEPISVARLQKLETQTPRWIDDVARAVVARRYRIVGSTTTFQQTSASVALLRRVKGSHPRRSRSWAGRTVKGKCPKGWPPSTRRLTTTSPAKARRPFLVRAVGARGEAARDSNRRRQAVQGHGCGPVHVQPRILRSAVAISALRRAAVGDVSQ